VLLDLVERGRRRLDRTSREHDGEQDGSDLHGQGPWFTSTDLQKSVSVVFGFSPPMTLPNSVRMRMVILSNFSGFRV